MENTNYTNENSNSSFSENFKDFYKNDFKNLLLTIFKNPTEGVHSIFVNSTRGSYRNSLVLYVSIIILYLAEIYLILGDASEYLQFSQLLRVSLIPAIFMFIISAISFGIKSVSSKPSFKSELLTGGLCAIPIGTLMTLILLLKIFGTLEDVNDIYRNPLESGFLVILVLLYVFLILTNILQQSLKSSGTKDAIAWYLSPIAILAASYITYQVSKELF